MAEVYPSGLNRIFYQSTGFRNSLKVTADILKPDLVNDFVELTELSGGLYYFDYNFYREGTWVGLFYEDGIKKKSQHWSIRKESGGGPRFLGPNVINS